MLFYYRCKYVLDFYIVLFLSMLSQAVVLNKNIFNLLYQRLIFIFFFLFTIHGSPRRVSLGRYWGQVNVTLHRRQRFNLAPRPAPFPLPQAAGRANSQPAVASGLADDLFIVVDVGYPSDRHHARLQHLRVFGWMDSFSVQSRTWFHPKSPSGKPHLHLLLRRELDDRCSVYFAQQNTACPFAQRKDLAKKKRFACPSNHCQ